MAAAGVDASNTAPGTVVLLPLDPDASATALRAGLQEHLGIGSLAVIVADTAGRPWREGVLDIAIGAAGVDVLEDLRGRRDTHDQPLTVTSMPRPTRWLPPLSWRDPERQGCRWPS